MYLRKFRTLLRDGNSNKDMRLTHQDLRQALAKTIEAYLDEKGKSIPEAQQQNLRDFVANALEAPLGAMTYPNTRFEWPPELQPVLNLAQEAEFARLSMMVDECENKAAAQGNSPEAIYQQTCYLEQFLEANKDKHKHVEIVRQKVKNWAETLYAQWGALIMRAKSRENLTQLMNQGFPENSSNNLPKMTAFREEIRAQIDYLENMDMFPGFYDPVEGKTLADKYQMVLSIYEISIENNQCTRELQSTLQGLLGLIIKKAFDPIEKQMVRRMSEHRTVDQVFEYLREFSEQKWRAFDDSKLFEELQTRLCQEEAKYRSWQELHQLERSTKPVRDGYPIPNNLYMFQMHTMKYYGDPLEDPRITIQDIRANEMPESSGFFSMSDWFSGDDDDGAGLSNGASSGIPFTPSRQMALKRDSDQVHTQQGDDNDLLCDEEILDDLGPVYKKRK